MQNQINEEFRKLVSNDSFISWVKNPTPELDELWHHYANANPEAENEINNAKAVIHALAPPKDILAEKDVEQLWDQIESEIERKGKKLKLIKTISWAATIILLIGLSSVFYVQFYGGNPEIDYKSIAKVQPEGNEVKLIFSDNSEKLLNSDDPNIQYDEQGKLIVDSESLVDEQMARENNPESVESFNQLVVPKGKRSSLILADGTKLHLNSGSRVIYPVVFKKKSREIYIEGEAYLDVSHSEDWPFVVATEHIKVKVLGTEFNVKSYPDEKNTSVVLVDGSVQALTKSKKMLMKESELLTMSNTSGATTIAKTNVVEHISWKDGWMHCNNESIESITKKLSRYYNIDIRLKDPGLKKLTMTGKLDLKTQCSDILEVMSFTAPIKFEDNNGTLVLSIK